MDEKLDLTALRRTALRRAAACTAVYALALASALFAPVLFGLAVCPGALAGTAAAWYWLKGLALCRGEKYVRKYFSRALRAALALPVFVLLAVVPLQAESLLVPAADRMESLLWLLPFALVSPVLVCIAAAVATHASVRHMRLTGEAEGRMYRELPFALTLLADIGLLLAAIGFVYMVVL